MTSTMIKLELSFENFWKSIEEEFNIVFLN